MFCTCSGKTSQNKDFSFMVPYSVKASNAIMFLAEIWIDHKL